MYLNMAGIVAFLIASIIIRRKLKFEGAEMDLKFTSCGDFSVYCRGIPKHFTIEKMKN
jgi:hypothetical protein